MSIRNHSNARAVVYSRPWGEERVAEFINKYPRACLIFRQITNHDWDYPVDLICRNQTKWERYKTIIKAIEKTDRSLGTPVVCKEYNRLVAEEYLPKIIERAQADQLFSGISYKCYDITIDS